MDKITELTEKQKKQLDVFAKEYLAAGLCTDPADRPKAEEAIREMYRMAGEEEPMFIWYDSPWEAMPVLNWLEKAEEKDLKNINRKKEKGILSYCKKEMGSEPLKYVTTYFWGSMDLYWVAFYKFPEKYLKVKYSEEDSRKLELWDVIGRSCGWWWPYEKVCVCTERPSAIHMEDNQLHYDGGPAIAYRDGWCLYRLHGVEVSKEIAETPGEKMPPEMFTRADNVEVRREVLRKMGLEKLAKVLDLKPLDKQTITVKQVKPDSLKKGKEPQWEKVKMTYELFTANVGIDERAKVLKMENASMPGIYHMEFVEGDTVDEAIAFRNGGLGHPEQLT